MGRLPYRAAAALAQGGAGDARPGGGGGALPDPGQGRQFPGPDAVQAAGGCALAQGGGGDRLAARAAAGLWPGPGHDPGLQRAARRHLRPGRPARDPQGRPRHLPPSPCAQPALPSRPADRRALPRHRARRQGHRVPAHLPAVQRPADPARDRHGLRLPLVAFSTGAMPPSPSSPSAAISGSPWRSPNGASPIAGG